MNLSTVIKRKRQMTLRTLPIEKRSIVKKKKKLSLKNYKYKFGTSYLVFVRKLGGHMTENYRGQTRALKVN